MATASRIWQAASATRGSRTRRAKSEAGAAARAQSHQKHAQNNGERIDRRPKQQRKQARPHHFRTQRRHPRKCDGRIDQHCARRAPYFDGRFSRNPAAPRTRDQGESEQRNGAVNRRGDIGRDGHVVNAQKVEPGRAATYYRTRDIGAVK